MKKEICFNINQSLRTTIHRIATYSMLVKSHISSVSLFTDRKEAKLLLQEGEHLLEICHQMKKGICFDINHNLQTILHSGVTS